MLPDGVEVNHKILSAVGEKVRGYKYSLRCKYVKEDSTKEALYHLDISKHPSNISDQMWVGLVDHFFSDKFQVGIIPPFVYAIIDSVILIFVLNMVVTQLIAFV